MFPAWAVFSTGQHTRFTWFSTDEVRKDELAPPCSGESYFRFTLSLQSGPQLGDSDSH